MSGQDRKVPDHFHQATELMQTIHGVKTLGYWKWYEEVSTWALQFEIDIGTSHHLSVPVITEWYVLITDRYPLGHVRVYPAFERGLNVTFHHQRFNQPRSDLPWTHGEICTDVPGYLLERLVPTKEPYSIRERLCWHIERAKEWIKAAAANDLIRTGERFELPDFRISTLGAKRFAYSEGEDSIRRWDAIGKKSGLVKLLQISQNKTIQIVPSTFLDLDRNILMEVQWSNYFRSGSDTLGGWVLLPEIPVIPPWQAPHTWGELFSSALELGVDLEISLNNVFSRLRDGQGHILLIGFPIPKLVGRPFMQIHWVAISLPRLSTIRKLKGFRPTAENAMRFDRTSTLSNNQVVKWLESNNWNRQSLGSRGNMEVIRQLNVVIIGQGALGSSIAEMLVRLGLEKIVLIDGDNVEAGNLSRHALTLREEKMNKSIAMALRLSSISPQAQVRNIDFYINPQNSQCREAIEQADLVIDCTADDEVLAEMHEFSWKNTAIFTSIFVGLYGKRVYIYSSPGWSFSSRDFKRALDPLIKEDYAAHPDFVLPHENIGCWHPIFPARSDDMWLACTLAVKEIESVLQTGKDHSELILIKYEDEIRREVVPLNGYYKYSAPDTPVSIRVVSSVFESLKVICRTSKARETGGILVGKYNEDGNVIEVLEALPPPDDSHGTISTFFRGIFGLSDKLTTRWEKSGTYYIGEWHYHTAGIGQPSNQDIVQMLEFAKAEEMQLAFPVMVIAFPSADNQYAFRVFLFTQDEQYSELNDTSEVPREKL